MESIEGMIIQSRELILNILWEGFVEHLIPGRLNGDIGVNRVNQRSFRAHEQFPYLLLVRKMCLLKRRSLIKIGILKIRLQVVLNLVQILRHVCPKFRLSFLSRYSCLLQFRSRLRHLRRFHKVKAAHPVVTE